MRRVELVPSCPLPPVVILESSAVGSFQLGGAYPDLPCLELYLYLRCMHCARTIIQVPRLLGNGMIAKPCPWLHLPRPGILLKWKEHTACLPVWGSPCMGILASWGSLRGRLLPDQSVSFVPSFQVLEPPSGTHFRGRRLWTSPVPLTTWQ